jgi:hypothetical protein
VDAQNFAKNLANVVISQLAEGAKRRTRARTSLELFADALSLVIGLWAEYG